MRPSISRRANPIPAPIHSEPSLSSAKCAGVSTDGERPEKLRSKRSNQPVSLLGERKDKPVLLLTQTQPVLSVYRSKITPFSISPFNGYAEKSDLRPLTSTGRGRATPSVEALSGFGFNRQSPLPLVPTQKVPSGPSVMQLSDAYGNPSSTP